MQFLRKHKTVIIYGLSLAALLVLLKLVEYKLMIVDNSLEIYAGSVAMLFMLLGIWITMKIFRPKKETIIIEKEKIIEKEVFIPGPAQFELNKKALDESAISVRELEVLQLMAKGLSNQEIASQLFVSVNTIKTHITNLFFKLDVSRRTQAVEKAKQLSIIR